MSETALKLSTEFLATAAYPVCHVKPAVDYERSELVCTSVACGLAHPAEDCIPVLLTDQARNTQ